jgi:endonuclease/exonuclease/phosphatase family metal-dependent hydrolase
MRLAPSQGFTGSRDDSGLLRTFPFLLAIGLVAISGCAERGTGPPRIDRLGSARSDLRGDSIRVATANLWGVSAFGIDWADEIDARFAAFAERLGRNEPGLDLVLIQEAWKDEARRGMLAHRGVIENFPHRVDALEQPGGAGLVVLSRFPIERAEFHRFRTQGRCFKFWEGDCLSGKGVLAVQVRIEERLFWVASTHLIACYSGDDEAETACDQWDPNGDARWSQLVEARQFMEELSGEAPALLGGDFNLTRSSRYYPAMTSATIPPDPPDAKVTTQVKESSDQRAEGWRESGERETVAQRIDYIWTRSGAHDRWQPRAPARLIFTDPVELASGESIAISDHPILAIPFCLVGRSAGSESTICKTHRP